MRTRRPVFLRTVTLCALWVAGAAGATAVGLTAIGAIGTGIAAPGPAPLDRAQVDSRLASAPPPPPPASPAPSTALDPAQAQVLAMNPGGTVVATCTGGVPRVLTISPAQGFQASVKQDDEGPRVKFSSDGLDVVGVLGCTGTRPTMAVEVKND